MLFSFPSTILYFKTVFDYDATMQDIDNWLVDSILVGSAYNMIGLEPLFGFIYFQLVL